MYETAAELAALQELLDASRARSTSHLRSIVSAERTVSAERLVEELSGMRTLALATVTARGEPRLSGVDGHFLHGRWIFGTARGAAKARHLAARPAASVAYMRGEEIGVWTHGHVVELNRPDGGDDPQWPEVLEHLTRHYGSSPHEMGDVVYYRLEPHWMVSYGGLTAAEA